MVVGLAAVLIIWRVGFYAPVPEQAEKPAETKVVTEPGKPDEVQKPGDADEPMVAFDVGEPRKLADVDEPDRLVAAGEPNEPMEFVNLKSVEMKTIIQKLAEWTGKVIIPTDESLKQKVTIYAPDKLPRSKALSKIYSALRMKGYIVEHSDDTIYLKPIAEARLGEVPTILADYPLAMIENKDQVVQKFFKLKNYSPSQMGEIIVPLIGDYGYVSADESTNSLLVIDTVKNLMRISGIIEQFDAVKADQTVTWIFEIHHGNPSEIIELLQTLLSEGGSLSSSRGPGRGRGPSSFKRPSPASSSSSKDKKSSTKGAPTSITVGTSQTPIVLIPEPKHNWIIAKASPEDIKVIGEWIEKLDKPVSTVLVDYPLVTIENKNQVVQKFFKLECYSPGQMGQIIVPLLTESGYVSADESTGNLLVIDTVENLMRIEMIIEQFDVPEADQAVTQIFEVRHGDPSEIVQMLNILLGESEGYSASRSRSRYDSRRSSDRGSSYNRSGMSWSPSRSGSRSGSPSSVVVGTTQGPIVLIPEPRRKWIIARSSAEVMKQIDEWIIKLDVEEPVESEYEVVQLMYADPDEVADSIEEGFEDLPGTEFLPSVLIRSLDETRQVMVFGRKDLREIVKKMIQQIDVDPGQFETRIFKLKYADPDEIKENLEGLYEQQSGSFRNYGFSRYSSRTVESRDTVKVISFSTMQQVTVIASPDNILEIAEQILEWDVPLDVAKVKPRIIELRNSDPIEMADLLTTLFSEESSRGLSFYDLLFGTGAEEKAKIVGPLYGQLTFEDVPGTKKIIVISKIPEAYDVIEQLILDLDKQEMGEVPKVVTLKYAKPEDLSERLNAMFCEAGTSSVIVRSDTGLSEYSMEESGDTSSTADSTTSQSQYVPWWSGSGARSGIDEEMPISNVIGRIRFVPEPRIKAILVLAPPEFMPEIEKLIEALDMPGKQVMIKAIIVEVDHSSMTSLGVQLAPDASSGIAFGSIDENTATILNQLDLLQTRGSFTFRAMADITAMLDFLARTTNAKILNQQTLWTEDNEEASFFKGEKVAFFTSATTSATAGNVQNFEFQRIGMTLAVRPSITPENNVDMIINIIISQLTSDEENGQPVRTEMETKTNMIVEDAQTIMLGGILFQKDSVIKRKVPVLGDVPMVGGVFRHNENMTANNEMLVFITPYVIGESDEMLPETIEEMERPKEKLKNIQEQLKTTMEKLERELP
jgi:general secretion pathway protein D